MVDIAAAAPEAASDQAETPQVATETTPPATETPAAETPTIEQSLQAVWDKNNPPRSPDGKFAPYKQEAAPAETETPAETPAEATGQPEAVTQEPATPAIQAPLSWSGEMKAKWADLPPDVQTYVAQRDKESHEAISRAGMQIKAFEPIGKVLAHFTETFKRNNLHPAEGIARLLNVETQLEKDPVEAVKNIAKAYGVDLQMLAGLAEGTPGEQPAADPRVAQLEAQLRETSEKLNQVTSYLTTQQTQQQTAGRDALARQISDFAEAKDASGNPLHPHFDRVTGTMAALLQANPEWDLAQAYSRAVRADDELYAEAEAKKAAEAEAKRQADARKKAEEARKSAAVNVQSSPGAGKTPRTMEDTLREVAQKHYGR